MIAINQVKSEIPWNGHTLQIRDMIDSEEVLRKKAAAVLHIDAVQIRKVEIIKHSLDARKKPQIWQVYTLGVTFLHEDMEAKIVKKCKNNNVTLVSGQAYTFPDSGSIRMNHRPVIIGMDRQDYSVPICLQNMAIVQLFWNVDMTWKREQKQ